MRPAAATIPIRSLKDGMLLSSAMYDASGTTVLLQRGTRITKQALERLQRHGHACVLYTGEMKVAATPRKPVLRVPEKTESLHDIAMRDSMQLSRRSLDQASDSIEELAEEQTHLDPRVIEMAQEAADRILSTLMLSGTAMRALGQLANTDDYTHGHSTRVSARALLLAAYHWTERGYPLGGTRVPVDVDQLTALGTGLILHDIGKLRTPSRILRKPGRLTTREYEVIKRHPTDGFEIVGGIISSASAAVILHHHERWDGGGYPSGLHGDGIPEAARIAAISDAFDAMTSERPYKVAMTPERGLATVAEEAGRMFDPELVESFQHIMGADAEAFPRLEIPVLA